MQTGWEHIEQLKASFQNAEEYLSHYGNSGLYLQKCNQLKTIEQSIIKLTRQNTPIPEDLRKLKLALLNEIEHFKAALELKKTALKLSAGFVKKHQQKRAYKTKSSKKETVQPDLFSQGNSAAGNEADSLNKANKI